VGDPSHLETPGVYTHLLSKEYAAERRKLIDPLRASLDQQRGSPVAGSDTVYFCVADRWGNACSFINSNYMGFGTGIVPSGWGFSLQNRGHNFDLEEGHPNALAPGKRPYHTIIPAMITRDRGPQTVDRGPRTADDGPRSEDDKTRSTVHRPSSGGDLFAALGVMGGFMQPQGHLQVFLALAQGLDPQAALDLPRFCIEDGTAGGAVALEEGLPPETVAALATRGHDVRVVSGWERAVFGRGQIILRDPSTGVLTGGSDGRADGCAMTLI
jgi:gamma-glutamyltranspeptidase/glutathione hydrolase